MFNKGLKIGRFLVFMGSVAFLTGCYSRYSVGSLTISPHVSQDQFSEMESFLTGFLLERGYEKVQVETLELFQDSVVMIIFSRVSGSDTDMPLDIVLKQSSKNISIIFFDVFSDAEGSSLKLLREEIRAVIQNKWPNVVMKYEWRINRRHFLDP